MFTKGSLLAVVQGGGGAKCTELEGRDRGEAEPVVPASAPESSDGRGGSRIGAGGGGGSEGGRGAASPSLPASNLVYKAKDYWDGRFAEEESYDVSQDARESIAGSTQTPPLDYSFSCFAVCSLKLQAAFVTP